MIKRRAGFKSESLQAAEIFGNISVAWFSAGVIVPFFGIFSSSREFFSKLVISLAFAGIFFYLALKLARKGQK